jgi:hypothetical protein
VSDRVNLKILTQSLGRAMSGRIRVIAIFAGGMVLAFVWGLYYVLLTQVGFDLDVTLAFLVPTIAVIAALVGMELYLRRGRARSRGQPGE